MLNNINYQSSNHEQAIKKSILIHGGFKKLTEADFYPEHEKRTATHEYIKVRDKIIIEENAHCVICGTNNEVLSNLDTKQDSKLNPFQARQMELHHFHIEWALANAIDVNKFNNFLSLILLAYIQNLNCIRHLWIVKLF